MVFYSRMASPLFAADIRWLCPWYDPPFSQYILHCTLYTTHRHGWLAFQKTRVWDLAETLEGRRKVPRDELWECHILPSFLKPVPKLQHSPFHRFTHATGCLYPSLYSEILPCHSTARSIVLVSSGIILRPNSVSSYQVICGVCRHTQAPGSHHWALQAGECVILPSLQEAPFYLLLLHGSTWVIIQRLLRLRILVKVQLLQLPFSVLDRYLMILSIRF